VRWFASGTSRVVTLLRVELDHQSVAGMSCSRASTDVEDQELWAG
jgi:hypothetical protein